jgi:hypothetical protein
MKYWKLALVAAGLIATMACVVTRHPIYTAKDVIGLPGLAGAWVDEKEETRWVFQAAKDKAFELTYTEKGLDALFEVRAVRLGEFVFLDICPKAPEKMNDFYLMHFLPVHTAFLARLDGDSLTLSLPNVNWLEKQAEAKKLKAAHEQWDDRLVLTGPTPELQKFLVKIAPDKEAFGDPLVLKRVK